MNPQDFDDFITSVCYPGENLVFAVLINGTSQRLMLRATSNTGLGIIGKVQKYIDGVADFREQCGAAPHVKNAKILVQFCNIIKTGHLSAYRRAWYRHWEDLAIVCHGRNGYLPIDILRGMADRSLQFQIDFDFDTHDIVDFKLSGHIRNALSSPGALRSEIIRSHYVNAFRAAFPHLSEY